MWADNRLLLELKNGKLLFRQKPLSLEKSSEAMQGTHICTAACPQSLFCGIRRDRPIPRDASDPDNTECTAARNFPRGVHTADSEAGTREVRILHRDFSSLIMC